MDDLDKAAKRLVSTDLAAETERLRQDLSDARDQLEAMAGDGERLRGELATKREDAADWNRVAAERGQELRCERAAREAAERLVEGWSRQCEAERARREEAERERDEARERKTFACMDAGLVIGALVQVKNAISLGAARDAAVKYLGLIDERRKERAIAASVRFNTALSPAPKGEGTPCGATLAGHPRACTMPAGHDGPWHDNDRACWPVTQPQTEGRSK